MKLIRKILVKLLGIKGYLKLVSGIYIRLISGGMMKEKYSELYFLKEIIRSGDTVADIGANLGYYSYFMAKHVQDAGRLIAVEPIPLFVEVWQKNMRRYHQKNIALHNCALGSENKDAVKMSIPIVNGVVRHGLTKVEEEGDTNKAFLSYEVPMRPGDELIRSEKINRLDFVKCDVEGFEQYVIPSLKDAIDKYNPMLQIELSGTENKENVVHFLVEKGYEIFVLKGAKLNLIDATEIHNYNQDFYFIHPTQRDRRKNLIAGKA